MPYVKQTPDFDSLENTLNDASDFILNGGDLNAAFSILADAYMESKGMRYQNMSDVIGALEGAKMEFQRRVYTPYEQKKLEENGDVYRFCSQYEENS